MFDAKVFLNSAGEYQMAGIPWVTQSNMTLGQVTQVSFGSVTTNFSIKNYTASTAMAVGFTQNGLKPVNSNFFTLSGSDTFAGEIRCESLWVSASVGNPSYVIVAGLTRIPGGALQGSGSAITGTNGFNGVG